MAGGKLSPRQKMINMMYLVLTALLALNVQREILKSFDLIASSLKNSSAKFDHENEEAGKAIKAAVGKEIAAGNKKNEDLLKQVDEVVKKSDELAIFLQEQIEKIYSDEIAGRNPETGKMAKDDEVEKNYHYWMVSEAGGEASNNGRGAGKAKEMKDKFDAYIAWANKFWKDHGPAKEQRTFTPFAIDPKDDPTIPANADDKKLPWEYYTFHNSPAIANVALLEKYKNDVRVLESELLTMLKGRLSEVEIKIKDLELRDAPVSQVVAAGMPFETQIYITAELEGVSPKFISGGIIPDPNGKGGKLRVFASAGVIPANAAEGQQGYTAEVEVIKADGTPKRLKLNKTFTVRRPVVQISSAAVTIMYKNCANEINIDVPALGEFYNPVVAASPGDFAGLVNPTQKRAWRIIPRGNKTVVNVATNTNGQVIPVGSVEFRVIPPPKPTIELLVNNARYDGQTPIPRGATLTARVVPDRDFAAGLPKDARYQLLNVQLKQFQGLSPAPVPVGPATNSQVAQLPAAAVRIPPNMEPGTRIVIAIGSINRLNFENKAIPEAFTDRELILNGVVR